ncbi:MAG: hypothetical protein IJV27_07815 [Prevotella sp.]|nr:hypothetical protein [Prevotella sp.]
MSTPEGILTQEESVNQLTISHIQKRFQTFLTHKDSPSEEERSPSEAATATRRRYNNGRLSIHSPPTIKAISAPSRSNIIYIAK